MAETKQQQPEELVVGVVLFDGVMALDFIGTTSYLELLPTIDVPVRFVTISFRAGLVRSNLNPGKGLPLVADLGYADAMNQKIDILLVPGGGGRRVVVKDDGFLAFIKHAAQNAQYVLTVCTGSGILATTGFLDGKRATTNKICFDEIVETHPNVDWVRSARWVKHGENLWTSSGIAAGMDMAHAFIADVYGAEAAAKMAHYQEIVPSTDSSNDPFA